MCSIIEDGMTLCSIVEEEEDNDEDEDGDDVKGTSAESVDVEAEQTKMNEIEPMMQGSLRFLFSSIV